MMDDAESILGVTALESVGIAVVPKTQKVKRLPVVLYWFSVNLIF